MTEQDRIKWDARYKTDIGDFAPAPIVETYWHLASCGHALDLACGNGRNSLFLAQKGFTIDAVDISTVATAHLTGRHPGIHVTCGDLDTYRMAPCRYEIILNIRFLDRRLLPMILDGLKPGGVAIVEAFVGRGKRIPTACWKMNCCKPSYPAASFSTRKRKPTIRTSSIRLHRWWP